jgi:hypothetical protein
MLKAIFVAAFLVAAVPCFAQQVRVITEGQRARQAELGQQAWNVQKWWCPDYSCQQLPTSAWSKPGAYQPPKSAWDGVYQPPTSWWRSSNAYQPPKSVWSEPGVYQPPQSWWADPAHQNPPISAWDR